VTFAGFPSHQAEVAADAMEVRWTCAAQVVFFLGRAALEAFPLVQAIVIFLLLRDAAIICREFFAS
jgi:hypothetical protein